MRALQDGKIDAFVMWWDLIMDPQGEITLSCAPCWVRGKEETIPVIFFSACVIETSVVVQGEEIKNVIKFKRY